MTRPERIGRRELYRDETVATQAGRWSAERGPQRSELCSQVVLTAVCRLKWCRDKLRERQVISSLYAVRELDFH